MAIESVKTGFTRVENVGRWIQRNPGDVFGIMTIVFLVVLGVLQFFGGDLPVAWFYAAFAGIVSSMTLAFLADRSTQRKTSTTVEELHRDVSRVLHSSFVREIPADRVGPELTELLSRASEWRFRGGSARWQRSVVLPTLSKITARAVPYRAQIINPFRQDLCERYADYRRTQRSGTSAREGETAKSIQLELLSFIYSAAYYAHDSRIEPTIALVDTYSPLRRDGSSESVVLTVADMTKAGLIAGAGGWYFASLMDEFDLQFGDATLILPKVDRATNWHTIEAAKAFFESLLSENNKLPRDAFDGYVDGTWDDLLASAFGGTTR